MAKFVFLNQDTKSKRPGDSHSMINAYNPPAKGETSVHSMVNAARPHKTPHSQAGYKTTTANQRGFMQSQHSIDSDNTIHAFLMKDSCGQVVKTKKVLEREHDRIEKVKRAREKAVDLAMEKTAKLILKERRYESNVRKH